MAKRQHRSVISPRTFVSGRTRFGDIVAEFWAPERSSQRAVILCDGCPSVPSKRALAEFFARKRYWVFHIRYRGTWESAGEFLRYPPHEDVMYVARHLNDGFADLWTRTRYIIDIREITVVGASFGGAAAMLSSLDPLVTKAVAIAPVVDWRAKGAEPFNEFLRQLHEGFPGAYRTRIANIRRLTRGDRYAPIAHSSSYERSKLFVMHAKDDPVVPYRPTMRVAKRRKLRGYFPRNGGHLSSSIMREKHVWERVRKFLAH